MNFSNNYLLYALTLLFTLFISTSYVRFIVLQDYLVAYEGTCDPALNSCFIGCSDDTCSEEYYYSEVQKYAPRIFEQCGTDITDCNEANICLPQDDENCSVTYCDPNIEGEECTGLIDSLENSSHELQSDEVSDYTQQEVIYDKI